MIVTSLELSNYRNYEYMKADFDPGLNLIYGDNAQGKTNALEAIYECAAGRSPRGSKDREIIRFEEEEAHVRLLMEKQQTKTRIDLHLKKNKSRGIAIDGIPVTKSSEIFGHLHAVFFSPEDLKIVKSGPAERRHFLDEELCQLSPLYTHALAYYNRALLQRNNLLREVIADPSLKELVQVYDEQLVSYGSQVIKEREDFLEELQTIVEPIHREITETEELVIRYEPSVRAEDFSEKLFMLWDTDMRMGNTSVGPHRDDFGIALNGIDVRRFGSQGQQRTAALSLKLAEIELVKRRIKDDPILLLDDVLSELDSNRREKLLGSLKHIQTFLTCTGLEEFVESSLDINKRFKVSKGNMTEEEYQHE